MNNIDVIKKKIQDQKEAFNNKYGKYKYIEILPQEKNIVNYETILKLIRIDDIRENEKITIEIDRYNIWKIKKMIDTANNLGIKLKFK